MSERTAKILLGIAAAIIGFFPLGLITAMVGVPLYDKTANWSIAIGYLIVCTICIIGYAVRSKKKRY